MQTSCSSGAEVRAGRAPIVLQINILQRLQVVLQEVSQSGSLASSKTRPDSDRKAGAKSAAIKCLAMGEAVDFGSTATETELPIFSANGAEMINVKLFARQGGH